MILLQRFPANLYDDEVEIACLLIILIPIIFPFWCLTLGVQVQLLPPKKLLPLHTAQYPAPLPTLHGAAAPRATPQVARCTPGGTGDMDAWAWETKAPCGPGFEARRLDCKW